MLNIENSVELFGLYQCPYINVLFSARSSGSTKRKLFLHPKSIHQPTLNPLV